MTMHGKSISIWSLLKEDMVIKSGLAFSLLLMIMQFVILLVYWTRIPPEVPLFYSLPPGTSRLAKKSFVLIIPFVSMITWLSSFLLIKLSPENLIIYRRLIIWFINISITLLCIATILMMYLIF